MFVFRNIWLVLFPYYLHLRFAFLPCYRQIAYNCIHTFYIICLSQTYLNSHILSNNDKLDVSGYNLIQVDYPFKNNWGEACIYFDSFMTEVPIIKKPVH